ncbi:MAG: ABC transporter ATP-binding protein [Actinomycetales bacterium]|nr:ABC transporter ATP-binding protein [Actinomycetales bacterium]
MNTTPPPVIEVTGVRRSYGGRSGTKPFEAVRGVDLTIERGELFALLGTNGAGKTSLMEVLEGLASPSVGRVRVLGHDPVRESRRVRPRTGVVLQESGFPGDLKVAEMASAWARTLSRPRRPAEVLDLVGLTPRSGVAISSLSGGERRRLDLALAVMGNPELLFLDEPTTGLDPESRRAAWDLVRGLVAQGTTVVLTTHYLEEAEQLADRLAVMHAGTIVRAGTPAELVAEEPARIEFTLDTPVELPALAGQHEAVRSSGLTRHSIETRALEDDLRVLLAWAHGEGISLGALDARSASLEQMFLSVASRPASDQTHPDTQEVAA